MHRRKATVDPSRSAHRFGSADEGRRTMPRRQVTFPLLFLCAALLCSAESWAQESIDPIVARLIEDLSNPDPDERVSSALALGNMAAGSKRDVERAKPAVPALARAMKDKNKEVREFAAFALGNASAAAVRSYQCSSSLVSFA